MVPSEKLTTSKRQKPIPKSNYDSNEKTISTIPFKVGEVVWCKIRGSPYWPAKILKFENRKYEVYWFNDYRRSKVFFSQLYKFEKYFTEFAKKFDSSSALETAAKEALMFLTSQ